MRSHDAYAPLPIVLEMIRKGRSLGRGSSCDCCIFAAQLVFSLPVCQKTGEAEDVLWSFPDARSTCTKVCQRQNETGLPIADKQRAMTMHAP